MVTKGKKAQPLKVSDAKRASKPVDGKPTRKRVIRIDSETYEFECRLPKGFDRLQAKHNRRKGIFEVSDNRGVNTATAQLFAHQDGRLQAVVTSSLDDVGLDSFKIERAGRGDADENLGKLAASIDTWLWRNFFEPWHEMQASGNTRRRSAEVEEIEEVEERPAQRRRSAATAL